MDVCVDNWVWGMPVPVLHAHIGLVAEIEVGVTHLPQLFPIY